MSPPADLQPADQPAKIPRPVFQFTIRQMMILVVLAATFCAGLLPAMRADVKSWPEMVLFECIFVPMVLALVILILVRPGPVKDWMMAVLPLAPVGAIVLAIFVAQWAVLRFLFRHGWAGILLALICLISILFVNFSLVGVFSVWIGWLRPRRCPHCGKWWMIHARWREPPEFLNRQACRWCLSCNSQFVRREDGTWASADLGNPPWESREVSG